MLCLLPVIPALWEARWEIMKLRDRDHPGQHGEISSLLNTQKLARCGGAVIPATQEAKAGKSLELGRQRL